MSAAERIKELSDMDDAALNLAVFNLRKTPYRKGQSPATSRDDAAIIEAAACEKDKDSYFPMLWKVLDAEHHFNGPCDYRYWWLAIRASARARTIAAILTLEGSKE